MTEEKGYRPTKKRLRRARREGKILKSPLLTQSVALLAGLGGLFAVVSATWVRNQMLVEYCVVQGFQQPEDCLQSTLRQAGQIVAACLFAAFAAGGLCECLQAGLHVDLSLIAPKAARLSLCQGVRKLASSARLIFPAALKLVLFVVVLGWFVRNYAISLPQAFAAAGPHKAALLVDMLLKLAWMGAAGVMAAGGVDYVVRRRQFYRELSMSLHDLQRETRDDEGDHRIKAARRSAHQELSMQDFRARVRKLKVVVVEKSQAEAGFALCE